MDRDIDAVLEDIETRWKDSLRIARTDCMEGAIRHRDRDVGVCREEGDFYPDLYNVDMYAEAGADIKSLIDIIKNLRSKKE